MKNSFGSAKEHKQHLIFQKDNSLTFKISCDEKATVPLHELLQRQIGLAKNMLNFSSAPEFA